MEQGGASYGARRSILWSKAEHPMEQGVASYGARRSYLMTAGKMTRHCLGVINHLKIIFICSSSYAGFPVCME